MFKPGKLSSAGREYAKELKREWGKLVKGNVNKGTCPSHHMEKPPALHLEASNTGDK